MQKILLLPAIVETLR